MTATVHEHPAFVLKKLAASLEGIQTWGLRGALNNYIMAFDDKNPKEGWSLSYRRLFGTVSIGATTIVAQNFESRDAARMHANKLEGWEEPQ
jgi:hypothetical protein